MTANYHQNNNQIHQMTTETTTSRRSRRTVQILTVTQKKDFARHHFRIESADDQKPQKKTRMENINKNTKKNGWQTWSFQQVFFFVQVGVESTAGCKTAKNEDCFLIWLLCGAQPTQSSMLPSVVGNVPCGSVLTSGQNDE